MEMQKLYLLVPLAPLIGAMIAGLFCRVIPRWVAHTATIAGVAIAFVTSLVIFQDVQAGHTFNGTVYTWLTSGDYKFEVGFLIDTLTTTMMLVVTFVSLMVHIYTIGYMQEDPGYNRFFSYISLFTFSMLMLVMANNFMQLFFGWEAVGLVSYLLIGFWYTRPTAIFANMKAFLVNRVGDFGFILGIGLVLAYFGSLDYATVFAKAPELANASIALFGQGSSVSLMTATCICLFIGAMGKSAQVPLHVWLPDSMEGPTPISALIHAATMVTAGIFMVARMSPLFELSTTALSFVIVIGAITALFMGFLGIIQNDIKRVVAYSTLSQLGYMTVALGASAYSVAIFHLMTHAFFKALLFLAAGSVIIGMHHDQDIRNMGGLRKYMPITWITSLIGSLALIGTPFMAGFYSKDSIIDVVKLSNIPGSGFAYFAVLAGVFVTAFYSFRMYFLVFHGEERFGKAAHDHHGDHDDEETSQDHHHGLAPGQQPHETPWVITLPLVLLAIPSVVIGYLAIGPMLAGDYFKGVIHVDNVAHPALSTFLEEFHSAAAMGVHALTGLPLYLALAGVVLSWFFYMKRPDIPAAIQRRFSAINTLLENKYYFDKINEFVLAGGSRVLGKALWRGGDVAVIDGFVVNGSAKLVSWIASITRLFQTGYVYHYAFTMIIGVFVLMTLWINRA
ncbi:NADH-quinone oxidoreductase subunit L [Dechloromonas denitrificans]|uniref:NADH-quinone oxidoreductase subunit L n=1 Tax=Dechloromonas denitrificans TaxID=281362 RepID=UPI001CF87BCA|nr:NADH-quinone oxidoreductase subunit L [Dechloromonas denitrificans]UCV02800.1 NADH-quinone oxidoreductase subunit L [Dechloromonas denitrificans]UCV07107.1 NADH-quinone oxidoreductase subunit L [Dechloromonas denitrificans]